jgi:hypothetical protein
VSLTVHLNILLCNSHSVCSKSPILPLGHG